MAGKLREGDRVSLWEFDTDCGAVGSGSPAGRARFASLVGRLQDPRGGTEIGGALERVCEQSRADDILLITDGKSYELDVQRLKSKGRRIFVVLVGEDSLEAKVGHLAVLPGGDTHFSFGSGIGAALQGLRSGRNLEHNEWIGGRPCKIGTLRGNVKVVARWTESSGPAAGEPFSAGVAAFAASLALPFASEELAGRLAADEGLVTHLTSLVLVDREGATHEGLPQTIKIDLPSPRTASYRLAALRHRRSASRTRYQAAPRVLAQHRHLEFSFSDAASSIPFGQPVGQDRLLSRVRDTAGRIDWDKHAIRLAGGDVSGLAAEMAAEIERLAAEDAIREGGRLLGMEPVRLVIALMAAEHDDLSRSADRVLRNLLRGVDRKPFGKFRSDLAA